MQTAVLPDWTIWVVSLATPLAALVGVLVGQWVTRRGATELETRSKREETLRNLRWAAELAVHDNARIADLGVAQLEALLDSELLDDREKVFVEAALNTVYEDVELELEELGADAEAVQAPTRGVSPGLTGGARSDVSWPPDHDHDGSTS